MDRQNITLVLGNPTSLISTQTGVVGTVFNMAQLSFAAVAPLFSNKRVYPHYNRLVPSCTKQAQVLRDLLLYYSKEGPGWTDVAIISTTDPYGTTLSAEFTAITKGEFVIRTYQQYRVAATNVTFEIAQIKQSSARLIVAFILFGWETVVIEANKQGLINEQHVWITSDTAVGIPFTNNVTSEIAQLSRGLLGSFTYIPDNIKTQSFVERFSSLDPQLYPAAGPDFPPYLYTLLSYDVGIMAGLAVAQADKEQLLNARVTGETWARIIRNITFEGLSGKVVLDESGDRVNDFSLRYFSPESYPSQWIPFGRWSNDGSGFTPDTSKKVVWFSNTTAVPDLGIPFKYWSCHKKEKGEGTGKTIQLRKPDGDDVNYIKQNYHCDNFIDCQNLSDESVDCPSNYEAVFIAFGIVTGLLILLAIILIVFVIVFGICMGYRRLRGASPSFLILILFSVIMGYSSVFAWFGKPHPVGCNFQPWLLGLSVNSMISALCVKNFRMWRIFRFPFRRTKISDFELLLLWILCMIPAFLILIIWTIISTPTAAMERRDGANHFVCQTGGFTGPPGGLVFFFILVAYSGFILLLGIIVSIAGRNIPSRFNESKLIAISIYNLLFLAAVIIPVFLVLQQFNPFIAWILRTLAILYAFSATMLLLFIPLVVGIFIIDKGRNPFFKPTKKSEKNTI